MVEGVGGPGLDPAAGENPARLAPGVRTHHVVRVVSVEVALPDQFPTVTLEDAEGRPARIAFRIGTAEGVALAHALATTTAPRPLTHELFALALERFGVEILAVRLTGRVGTTYLAEIELAGPAGHHVLSCRPSDGICLALRQRPPAPVLCDERLFVVDGDVLAGDEAPDEPDAVQRGDAADGADGADAADGADGADAADGSDVADFEAGVDPDAGA